MARLMSSYKKLFHYREAIIALLGPIILAAVIPLRGYLFLTFELSEAAMGACKNIFKELWCFRQTIIVILAPIILAVLIPLHEYLSLTLPEAKCLYMLLLMAVYWCTEVVNLAVTSLLPLFLAPIMSLQKAEKVSTAYLKDLNVMFLGGLIVAGVVEHSGLHKRLALGILRKVGTNPRLLLLGFMIPTWFLSMWMSNTATTAMMLAIVQAVIAQLKAQDVNSMEMSDMHSAANEGYASTSSLAKKDLEADDKLDTADEQKTPASDWDATARAMSLCVAYASTCGGIATLTGTAPNIVLSENCKRVSKEVNVDLTIDFATWMGYAIPISVIMLLATWVWLQIVYIGFRGKSQSAEEKIRIKKVIDDEFNNLGSMKWKEGCALLLFVSLTLLWITKDPGGAGGWASLFNSDKNEYVTDATAAILIAILCFLCPSEKPDYICWRKKHEVAEEVKPKPRAPLITWEVAVKKVPWGLILLLGGGFALADVITVSGLSHKIGNALKFFAGWNDWAVIVCISTLVAAITEVTSNTAIATIFLPIVSGLAINIGRNPLLFMLPVTISSSFAFMLPVATPPNALVFATGVLRISDMAKIGFLLNIVGVGFTTVATMTYAKYVVNMDWNVTATAVLNSTTGISNTTTPGMFNSTSTNILSSSIQNLTSGSF